MTSWDNKLKPCPFCWGKARIRSVYRALGEGKFVWPECEECGARMPDIFVKASYCANDKAVEAWNRRASNETV
jgi:Lar family restriction alleviation protein